MRRLKKPRRKIKGQQQWPARMAKDKQGTAMADNKGQLRWPTRKANRTPEGQQRRPGRRPAHAETTQQQKEKQGRTKEQGSNWKANLKHER